jgi:excinuclease ABC subunit B
VIFVSATPSQYEFERSGGVIVEQIIRPTGLLDPVIEVRPVEGQVQDVIHEARIRASRDQRVLVTTLTKRFAEELTEYLTESGLKVRYMHSDIEVLERVEIIRELQSGTIDVLIGINLLREGLDLPEVSLVCVLDADKEGFLRSSVALIQTVGRAARNVDGMVILYADTVTRSMRMCMDETDRRREVQRTHNEANGITPRTIRKTVRRAIDVGRDEDEGDLPLGLVAEPAEEYLSRPMIEKKIEQLKKEMRDAAQKLDFELAAALRDKMLTWKARL